MYQTHHFPPLWFPDIIEKKEKKKKKMVLRYGIPVLSIFNVTVDHSFSYNNINCKSWEKQRYRKQNSLKPKKNNDQERHISVSDKAGLLPPCF